MVRSVSRTLAKIATPLCFDSIFLSIDPLDLEKAKDILKEFTSMIKTLVISPVRYESLAEVEYRKVVQTLQGSRYHLPKRTQIREHISLGYKDYSSVQERSSHPRAQYDMLSCLSMALQTAPNLEKVVITHRRRHAELTGQELAKFCSLKKCQISVEMHAIFRLSPHQSRIGRASPDVSDALSSIIMFSKPKVRELIVEPGNTRLVRDTMSLCFKVAVDSDLASLFFTTTRRDISNFMSNLSRLRLEIDTWGNREPSGTDLIASMLAYAGGLEHLFLQGFNGLHDKGNNPTTTSVYYMLRRCRFQRLRVFVLGHSIIDGDDLLPLIASSPVLKSLVIDKCFLVDDQWEHLIEGIKANTCLNDLVMDRLSGAEFGEFWGDGQRPPNYVDCAGDVNNFILHEGPNPFSVESRKRYMDTWWSDGKCQESPMRVKEYYEAYF